MNSAKKLSGCGNQQMTMPDQTDAAYMAVALREAERGLYTAHPNPRVGCVLVKNDHIVGSGFHLRTGLGHAEANALLDAGDNARGSVAYTTLEPCSFAGRTPSCADALIRAGIKRVVYGMADPHPKNSGAGFKKLKDAGIDVSGPVLENSAQSLNPGHTRKFQLGLPFVRLKMAMSIDGKTALANGESQWITSAASRRDVQRLRARSSAIVTGVQTVIDDDPALTVRAAELDIDEAVLAAEVERMIVVLDPQMRIPAGAKLLNNTNMILATLMETENSRSLDVEIMPLPDNGEKRLDLRVLLEELARRDCNEVLFECGATLAGSLLSANLVDELVIYMAPKLMGNKAESLVSLGELTSMQDVLEMEFTDIRNLGGDIRITARNKVET